MKKVSVKKIDSKELEVLQYEMERYAFYVARTEIKTGFLNTMITIDISRILFLKLRTKIENSNTTNSVTFSISEAAIILKCCICEEFERSIYNRNVLLKFNIELDQQLKSLI